MAIFKVKQKKNKRKIYFCGIPLCTIPQDDSLKQYVKDKFDKLFYIVLPAQKKHPDVFSKYKDMYKGRDVVLCATGPTFNYYTPIPGAIHVGVNNAYKNEKVQLDYLFAQDGENVVEAAGEALLNYRKRQCKKFFGIHYLIIPNLESSFISEKDAEQANAERYYFLLESSPLNGCALGNADLTSRPLLCLGSTVFCALDFILWTNPKRVFLVGCDCVNNGHFIEDKENKIQAKDENFIILKEGWKDFKKFVRGHYPNTEIISINPKGLKGLFQDAYTVSFLEKSPELANSSPTLLENILKDFQS